jgi:two-component system sensor histidine kinase BaeS
VRKKLAFKICIAFVSTFFLVLLIMIGSIQFFAYQNFSDYLHKAEIEMLDVFVDRLSEEYAKEHSWDSLKGGYWKFYRILSPTTLRDEIAEAQKKSSGLGPAGADIFDSRYVLRMASRLTLFDEQKRPLSGYAASAQNHTLVKIVFGGRIVGWLGLRKHERLSHPLDVAYLKEQSKVFYLVGAGMLLLVAVVSIFLSRHLLAPIKRLTAGTRALTSFQFNTRIDVRTQDELGQLAADFNVLARTLEKSEEMRKQWLTDVSHELRTPLSILRGEIEAMQDGVRQPDQHAFDSIHAEVIYLSKIVNDLHDLSLAEAGSLPFHRVPVDPAQVLRKTLVLFETRFAEANIRVSDQLGADGGPRVNGDADRLTQLFSNLFENALRYVDRPGVLKIWEHVDKNRMSLFLEDSGPGVPEDSVERLFDRLYRVDSARTRERGGSGLGLSICKKIVEAHGGAITAENASSGGLRFQIVFPL